MEIDNNTNISNLIASSISKLNLSQATGTTLNPKKQQTQKPNEEAIKESIKDDVKLINEEKISKSPIDVSEVKKYAGMIGEELTDEEIKYGLMYGRSVIADFSA